jgi:hypothetical protein
MLARWLGLLLAVTAEEPGGSARSNQRIQAVVDTLGDLLKSIENEEEAEGKNFKCFEKWCDKEIENAGSYIEDQKLKIEDLGVSIDQHKSTIERNKFAIEKGKEEAGEIQDGIDQATSIREEEESKYSSDRAMNQQSVGQIRDAIQIVKKAQVVGSFAQGEAKMQIAAPGESGFVLGVFQSLEKNLVRNQQKADAIEQKKVDMYNSLSAGKSQQLGLVQGDIRSKSMLMSEANQRFVDSQNDLSSTQEALEAADDGLKDTTEDCDTKKKDFALRTEDRQKEKAAIREAMSYLKLTAAEGSSAAPAAPSFVQVLKKAVRESQEQAPAFVQVGLDKSLNSLSSLSHDLSSLSQQVNAAGKSDSFEGVKKVINELIAVLVQEQKDEKVKKDWCIAEKEKNVGTNTSKSDELERTVAALNKGRSLIEQLSTEADSLNATITADDAALAEAGKLRKEEKEIYERGKKDRELALKVLQEATNVLEAFYKSKPALVQTGDSTSLQTAGEQPKIGDSKRKTGEGNVVLVMLAKILDDIRLEQKHAAEEELASSQAYDKLKLDTRHSFDAMMMEITEKVTRRAKLTVKMESATDDKSATEDSLKALKQKMGALASECDELVKDYDKREKARKFETDQLRDAFEILSGSQIAARTAFLSAERSFVNQRTTDTVLRQLQSVSKSVGALIQAAS